MIRSHCLSVFVLIASVAGARSVLGQDPADTVELAPVVVTPTRQPVPLGAVTAATTVISGAELRARGIQFVLDALRDVPGAAVVQAGSFGGVTSLFLRGGNSNYVKVLVDGVPVNEAGGSFDFSDLTTADVERIEIVRGPASVIYGSDAVSGVVQIITRSAMGRARAHAAVQGGTYGTSVIDAAAASGDDRAGYAVNFSRLNSNGTFPFNSNYRNGTIGGRIRVAPDSTTSAAFTARYTDRTYRFPTDGSGAATDSNQVTNGSSVVVGLEAARRLLPRLDARLNLALHTSDDAYDNRPDSPGDSLGFAFASSRTAATSRRSVDARLIARPLADVAVTAGAQVELERERQFSETSSDFGGGATSETGSFDAHRRTTAAYLQASAELSNGFAADGGARLDDNSAFGTFTTYRAGVSYRLRTGTRLRASAGTAYKAPTFSENFAATPFEIGNPDLRPERSSSWEVGAEQRVLRGVTVGATYFDQRFRDLIQYVSGAANEPTYANLARAAARGVELTAAATLAPIVTVTAQYTGLRTRVTDAGASVSPVFALGQALVRRPAHSGRIGVRVRPFERASLSANVNFIGHRDDVDFRPFPAERVTQPGYRTVELAGELAVLQAVGRQPSLTLTARVENMFDAKYEPIVGFPGRRRAVLAGGRIGL